MRTYRLHVSNLEDNMKENWACAINAKNSPCMKFGRGRFQKWKSLVKNCLDGKLWKDMRDLGLED